MISFCIYYFIRFHPLRHNWEVERSDRKDEKRFYDTHDFSYVPTIKTICVLIKFFKINIDLCTDVCYDKFG